MDTIESTYLGNTPSSACSFARALESLGGGTSRGTSVWGPHPLTLVRGNGARVYDEDGREYIDLVNNHGSLIHGHSFHPIQRAVSTQLENGATWSAGNLPQLDLAELMLDRVSDIERIRFTNSGMEATNLAILIARTVTGRSKILKAERAYHGSLHEFMVGWGPAAAEEEHGSVLTAPFGDTRAFEQSLAEHGSEVAAVLLEPVFSIELTPASADFLSSVQRAAHEAGALLIVDEVLTFRLGYEGQKGEIGATSDLTTFGKIIGGGFPVGAVGGRAELMEIFHPDRPSAFHSGTFNGHPVTMVAGKAALEHYGRGEIEQLERVSQRIESELTEAGRKVGVPLTVKRVGSLVDLELSTTSGEEIDRAVYRTLALAGLNHGLFLTGMALYLSTAIDQPTADEIIERGTAALQDLAKVI